MGTRPRKQPADSIPLVPPNEFREALKKVLSNTKRQSDKQLARLQTANLRKRQTKKRG